MMKSVGVQGACLALANLSAEVIRRIFEWVQPVLTPFLTVAQIAIAIGTFIWILERVKGAKLDNRLKQQELDGRK